MIVFSGKVSDKIQTKTLKKRSKEFFKIAWALSSVLIVVSGILLFFLLSDMKIWLMLSCMLIGALLLAQIFDLNGKLPFKWHFTVRIDNENVRVQCPLWKNTLTVPVLSVKKVINAKNFFYLVYSDTDNCIICQKNLLTEGSIDEFKRIFRDKIQLDK